MLGIAEPAAHREQYPSAVGTSTHAPAQMGTSAHGARLRAARRWRCMLQRICVALNESEEAARALPVALDLADRCGAQVTLVHVASAPADDATSRQEAIALDLLAGDGERQWSSRLRGLAAAAPDGIDVDAHVAVGDPRDEIPAVAAELGADLIVAGAPRRRWHPGNKHLRWACVAGRPGRRGPLGALRGSVAWSLMRSAPCPVMLVPEQPGARAADGRSSWIGMQLRASLLARIFAVNAFVLVLATLLLIVTPLQISSSVVLTEVLVVAGGLAVMLAADFALLHRTLAPLRAMTSLMRTIDPLAPGRRLPSGDRGGTEVAALADAFNGMLDRLETERRESARRALAAQEEERLRIARELHDQVGQTLTAITIQAERAAAQDGPVDPQLLDGLAKSALQGVDDVRRIARELRPEALDDLGLVNALIALCSRVAQHGDVVIDRDFGQGPLAVPELPPEIELVLYRVAQESLTNAIRHAAAARIEVRLHAAPGGVELVVRDDGIGIPASAAGADTAGLAGMRERAMLVGGTVDIRPATRGGTEVKAWVPAP